ncbi:MAG: ABC transporter permease subunit [Promethearchaeota archaeon]
MNKISNSKNYIWSFPLLAGILTIIGLFTPSSAHEEYDINWMWGLRNSNLFAVDSSFGWIFELPPKDFTIIIFLCKIIPFFIFIAISILSIIFAVKVRESDDFRNFERKWLLCGVSFIVLGILYLIEVEIVMQHYFEEYFDLDISYWEEYTPGFGIIAPFVSGAVILIGFVVNKYVLVPEKRELIIRVTKLYRNIIFSFLIVFFILFIGVSASFIVSKLMPGDPVIPYLPPMFTQEQYEAMEEALGLDKHIIIQFFRHIGNFFIGNWGISTYIVGSKVSLQIIIAVSRMIGLFIFPLIIGVGAGILLGRYSYRYRGRWKDKLIQIFTALGISIPVFFFGMVLQFFFSFKINIFSPIGNYAVPMYIMTISTFTLTTWHTRSQMVNKPYETSVLPNSIKIAQTFGYMFMFYLLLDVTFNLGGMGSLLLNAINHFDYYLLTGVLFGLIIITAILALIANLIFSYNKFRESEIGEPIIAKPIDNEVRKGKENVEIDKEESIKDYLLRRLKSPYTIIGVVFIIFFVFISIFPRLFTEYTFKEMFDVGSGSWNPPSSDHPLGQSEFGRDVLGLVVYGIRTSMCVGLGAIFIGLIGGVPLGLLTGIYNRKAYKPIMGLMILFYIFPGLVFVILSLTIWGKLYFRSLFVIGILLIPCFTRVIANAVSEDIKFNKIFKNVICHIPLNFAFAVLTFEALGFIGYEDGGMIELGKNLNDARMMLYTAPWAVLWSGLAIFVLVLSFLIFHVGLQSYNPKLRELENLELT